MVGSRKGFQLEQPFPATLGLTGLMVMDGYGLTWIKIQSG